MLARFDLIVAMEVNHALRIAQLDAAAGRKCVVLAVLDPDGGPLDIPDPDGKPRSTFSAVYTRIVRCVEQLNAIRSGEAHPIAGTAAGSARFAKSNADGH
jgi:protein-tyrosine-phosphatase